MDVKVLKGIKGLEHLLTLPYHVLTKAVCFASQGEHCLGPSTDDFSLRQQRLFEIRIVLDVAILGQVKRVRFELAEMCTKFLRCIRLILL